MPEITRRDAYILAGLAYFRFFQSHGGAKGAARLEAPQQEFHATADAGVRLSVFGG